MPAINLSSLPTLLRTLSWAKNPKDSRAQIIKKNATGSFIIMILQNIVQIALVPVVIGFIDPLRYGIWLTISSFLGWFLIMDIGIGGGFRTRLGEAIAIEDWDLAKTYVSTAYLSLSIIALLLLAIYYILRPIISWTSVFNAPANMENELARLMDYVVIFFVIKFVLQLINNVYTAFRKTALTSLINFLGSLLALCAIYIIAHRAHSSLLYVGIAYSIAPLAVYAIFTIIFFSNDKKYIYPSLSYFRISQVKSMLNLGILILINQLSVIVITTSTNFLIAHITSPEQVTPYSVTMRMFSFPLTVFEIAVTPLLPAFTNAYYANDIIWIKRVLSKSKKLTGLAIFGIITLIPMSKFLIKIWLKGKVTVPWSMVLLIATYVALQVMISVYSKFFNGIGKLKKVTIITVINLIIYMPLAIALGKYADLGVSGIIIAKVSIGLMAVVFFPIIARQIIQEKEKETCSLA